MLMMSLKNCCMRDIEWSAGVNFYRREWASDTLNLMVWGFWDDTQISLLLSTRSLSFSLECLNWCPFEKHSWHTKCWLWTRVKNTRHTAVVSQWMFTVTSKLLLGRNSSECFEMTQNCLSEIFVSSGNSFFWFRESVCPLLLIFCKPKSPVLAIAVTAVLNMWRGRWKGGS